jgi:mannose-6-phosphate isomerase-like protein (cupin superfamily)
MKTQRLHIREADGQEVKDICGFAIDLINPEFAGSKKISLATIFVDPHKSSKPHCHEVTEEIYYFIRGHGKVIVEDQAFNVGPGSAVYIPLRKLHQVINTSSTRLKFISADAPPFDPKDIFYRKLRRIVKTK